MSPYFLYFFCIVHVAIASTLHDGKTLKTDLRTGKQSNVGLINAFQKIPATAWDYSTGGVEKTDCADDIECAQYAGNLNNNGIIGYKDVDFKDGARGILMMLSMDGKADHIGKIHLHLDDPHSEAFAVVITGDTGDNENWTEVRQFIEFIPSGLHDFYLTFSSDYSDNVGNINWFQFVQVLESTS